ncbi:hypothetical protein [Neorhodopirellula lusitana]|uniref:hypothetical protein n=1 Tax=Neorhodopirellula lusitana TaxID=445327 RepID=UPI0024B759E1|nr:hypothetical protein [Neorhodopirellula lusitana]
MPAESLGIALAGKSAKAMQPLRGGLASMTMIPMEFVRRCWLAASNAVAVENRSHYGTASRSGMSTHTGQKIEAPNPPRTNLGFHQDWAGRRGNPLAGEKKRAAMGFGGRG